MFAKLRTLSRVSVEFQSIKKALSCAPQNAKNAHQSIDTRIGSAPPLKDIAFADTAAGT